MKKAQLIVAILVAALLGFWYANSPGHPAQSHFVVAQGERTSAIAQRLKDAGFVHSALLFRVSLRLSGLAAKIQPGVHDLGGARSYGDIAKTLSSGGVSERELTLTIPEGWTIADINGELGRIGFTDVARLTEFTGVPGVDNLAISRTLHQNDWKADFNFLKDKPDGASLEGYLFPDTYRIYADGAAQDVVRRLLDGFDRKLTPELRSEIARQGKTIFDVVTMASIIEREVRDDPDRAIVADIFWRRLDAGMPLQADSTVNYVTGKGIASVTFDDTQIDSRYNTYKYRGMPFGPISNPGLASLVATLRPQANQYWYFLTDANGAVHYAKTLDEHNRNKAKYLR